MDPVIGSIMDSLRRLNKGLRQAAKESVDHKGLRVAQFFVLQQLGRSQSLSLNELAARTYSHQSTVSVVVDVLVKKGFVKRSPSPKDRRQIRLSLSAAGKAMVKKRVLTIQESFIEAIETFSREEREKLSQLLATFVSRAGLGESTPEFFFEEKVK